jgi:hypothetical protein
VVPLDLRALGGAVLCQRDAFLASLGAVSVSAELTKRVSAGLLGGEGFVLQRLEGSGLAFITAAGTLVQKVLAPGEAVLLDAGCLVALQPCVDYSVTYVGSIRRALFAGEGAFMARVTGPGLVVLQSVREHGTGRVGGAGGERGRGGGAHRRVVALLALLLTASTPADARHACCVQGRHGRQSGVHVHSVWRHVHRCARVHPRVLAGRGGPARGGAAPPAGQLPRRLLNTRVCARQDAQTHDTYVHTRV